MWVRGEPMHEWALAEAVVSTALKVAKEEQLREITKIKVKMGELQQIDRKIFTSALKEIILPQEEMLKNAQIEIEAEKAAFQCRVCGHEWTYAEAKDQLDEEESESIHFIPEISHCYLRCPQCKSPDFKVIKGRGVWIDSIEGEQ